MGNIELSMEEYSSKIALIDLPKDGKKQWDTEDSEGKRKELRRLNGALVWVEYGTLPPTAYAGPHMQQKIPKIKVMDLVNENADRKELKELTLTLRFKVPSSRVRVDIITFSDASFSIY